MYFLRNMTLNLAFLSLKKAVFTNQFLQRRPQDENGANSTELYNRFPLAELNTSRPTGQSSDWPVARLVNNACPF